MIGTKTVVILTIPKMGKTSYAKLNASAFDGHEEKGFITFDIGYENYDSIEKIMEAIKNIIYITRKNNINSIILANWANEFANMVKQECIPYYGIVPDIYKVIDYIKTPERHMVTDNIDIHELRYNLRDSISHISANTRYKKVVKNNTFLLHNAYKIFEDQNYFGEWITYDTVHNL